MKRLSFFCTLRNNNKGTKSQARLESPRVKLGYLFISFQVLNNGMYLGPHLISNIYMQNENPII